MKMIMRAGPREEEEDGAEHEVQFTRDEHQKVKDMKMKYLRRRT